jgi:hypothetical protein
MEVNIVVSTYPTIDIDMMFLDSLSDPRTCAFGRSLAWHFAACHTHGFVMIQHTTADDASLAARLDREEREGYRQESSTTSASPVLAIPVPIQAEPVPQAAETASGSVLTTVVMVDGIPSSAHHIYATRQQVTVDEAYCGPISCAVACCFVLFFWPAAFFVPCCPCDSRRVTRLIYMA